jgi:NAD(P)H-hydrate repair Nnr-like enzyme with NAD(P)H-hydrate dehydratase domain
MVSHSTAELQKNAPPANVAAANTADLVIDADALWLLREFFLLLNEWDKKGDPI